MKVTMPRRPRYHEDGISMIAATATARLARRWALRPFVVGRLALRTVPDGLSAAVFHACDGAWDLDAEAGKGRGRTTYIAARVRVSARGQIVGTILVEATMFDARTWVLRFYTQFA